MQRTKSKHWEVPIKWDRDAKRDGKIRFVFPSLCDPFDPQAGDLQREFIALIRETPNLKWLLLTKRPQNVPDELPPNAWLGVTVCNQKECDEKIPILLKPKVTGRFVSCEPLLGPIKFPNMGCGCNRPLCNNDNSIPHIDWVIVGGETGPGARPMQYDWVDDICGQCILAGVDFMFKQWGEWAPDENHVMHRVGKEAAGRLLDGREYSDRPNPRVNWQEGI